jgi:hypothetical protein
MPDRIVTLPWIPSFHDVFRPLLAGFVLFYHISLPTADYYYYYYYYYYYCYIYFVPKHVHI